MKSACRPTTCLKSVRPRRRLFGAVLAGTLTLVLLTATRHPAFADNELSAFAEYRYGVRTHHDPHENSRVLNETRLQIDDIWYGDAATIQLKVDLLYDDLMDDKDDIDLENGHGFVDLRKAYILFSPLPIMDVKLGRQVLTWGTGDLIFINDLFPKDWQSFFLGRDEEYLKSPSDAILVSLFPSFANFDIAYTPRFDPDRYISGERISYWNGRDTVGRNSVLKVDRPNNWFGDDEIALRVYQSLGASEAALYAYRGFWKSPGGFDPDSGRWTFPRLNVFGASLRGNIFSGIGNIEAGYYDSQEDRDGDDPFVNNSEMRLLLGYEREVIKDFTIALQYYLEHMMHFQDYLDAMDAVGMDTSTARDEDRHTLTLRLTRLLMNQNLILGCFTRYSPTDHDAYIKPTIAYKVNDNWKISVGGNFFVGRDRYTFLNQFRKNNNVFASIRYSF